MIMFTVSCSCRGSVDCTVRLRICHSTSSSKVLYWIEIWCLWRPLECTELIVMSVEPVWDHVCCVTWSIILLVAIRNWVDCGRKWTILQRGVAFKWCSVYIKGPNVPRKHSPHHYTKTSLTQGRTDPWTREIEIHRTRQCFSCSFGEPMPTVASVFCFYLTGGEMLFWMVFGTILRKL